MDAPTAQGRLLIESVVALVVIAVMVMLLSSNLIFRRYLTPPAPIQIGDSYAPVLSRLDQQTARSVSVYFGFAAWDASDSGLNTLVVPGNLDSISPRTPDHPTKNGTVSAFNRSLVAQAAGGRLQVASYDDVLTPEQLRVLRSTLKEQTYPKNITAFIAARPEERVAAFTDASRKTIYLVPYSASPLAGAR